MMRLHALAGLTALLMGALSGSGQAQEQPAPVPMPAPGAETAAPQPPSAAPQDMPVTSLPVPQDRPGGEPAPGATQPEADVVQPTADPAAPEERPDDAAQTTPPGGEDTADEPEATTPRPAYVSPDKARTRPEPGAPETPDAAVTPEQSVEAAAALLDAEQCEGELTRRGVRYVVGDSLSEGDCGVLRPVRIEALSTGVTVEPPTQMLCRTALALDIWVAEGVAKASAEALDGRKLDRITQASTYVCRARASESRISEHSRGSAIDIAAFAFADASTVDVKAQAPDSAQDRFLAAARRSACGPFRTVIGPGTDADHATHFHLDIAARNNDSTYCR